MPDLGPLAGALLELLRPALAALLRSALGMAVLSVAISACSFYVAAQGGGTGRGVLAALFALIVGAIFGAVLSVKRAVLSALLSGLARLDLGGRALQLLFGRLLGVGEGGGAIARAVEKLPLGEAERRLSAAVAALLGEGEAGWLRRKLRERLLQSVAQVTLARFRSEGPGGVDLAKVQRELSGQVNDLVAAQVQAILTKLTAGLVLLTAVLALGAAFLLRQLPR